jgi:hypothetical protein
MDATTVNTTTVQLLDPTANLTPATVTYNAATFTATLAPTAPLAAGITYTALVRGGGADPRVKDVAGNALAVNTPSTFTTTPPPPQVVSTTPADGAIGVPANIAPTAKFSSPLNQTTVNATTVLLSDTTDALNPVPVAVTPSYEPNSSTIAIVPAMPLQETHIYTVTLKGGAAPSITDTLGQPLSANFTFGFATAPATALMGASIFAPTDTPATPVTDDQMSVEVGLRFRSDNAGLISGVRFFKGGAANGGIHIGHLWANDGTPLGSVTFTSETESGWQEARFQTPIPITANTTYVVSYFAPLGNYASTPNQFASSGVDAPPLHALQNGIDGSNGVFLYTTATTGGFPTDTFNSTNYWVDVVFSDAPQVLSVNPAPGAAGVLTNAPLTATFSEALDDSTVNETTVLLRNAANTSIPITVSYDSNTFTITITPAQALQPKQAYTVILKGGIIDSTGTPLSADYIWSFTTAP